MRSCVARLRHKAVAAAPASAALLACLALAACTPQSATMGSGGSVLEPAAWTQSAYAEYSRIVETLQEQYGEGTLIEDEDGDYLEGLFFVDMVDIDGDGLDELIAAHSNGSGYDMEAYGYDIEEDAPFGIIDGYLGSGYVFVPICVWEQDGGTAVVWGDIDLEDGYLLTLTRFLYDGDELTSSVGVAENTDEDEYFDYYVDWETVGADAYAKLFDYSDADGAVSCYYFVEGAVTLASSDSDESENAAAIVEYTPAKTLAFAQENIAILAKAAEE